jgi:hypothetical protein
MFLKVEDAPLCSCEGAESAEVWPCLEVVLVPIMKGSAGVTEAVLKIGLLSAVFVKLDEGVVSVAECCLREKDTTIDVVDICCES